MDDATGTGSDADEALRLAAAEAVARGSLLFHLDLAATIARDHVAARAHARDADGWAVDVGPQGYEVTFIALAPTEAHVYLSLRHGIPLSVITTDNDEHWIVNGERVSLL